MTTKRPEFPKAAFYDCMDSDSLSHTSPEEAVESYLEGLLYPCTGLTTEKLAAAGSVTVGCYEREEIPPKFASSLAAYLVERLDDEFAESEYANQDGDAEPARKAAAHPHMLAAVEAYLKAEPVWPCKKVKEVTLTPEQVEAMMREHCPEWFDP